MNKQIAFNIMHAIVEIKALILNPVTFAWKKKENQDSIELKTNTIQLITICI